MSLFHKRRSIIIALGVASVTGVAALIFVAATVTTAQAPPDIATTEDYRALAANRYEISRALTLADPRVQEVLKSAVLNRTDYELLDNEDKVIINTWGKRSSIGSWQDGYVNSYSEGKIVNVLVDRKSNEVSSVNITPREDEVSNWSFSDNQKKIISILVSDPRFQDEFAGKTDATDYFFSVVRNVASDDPTSTGIIVITSPADNKVLYFARIDPVAEKVLSVEKGSA